MRNVRVWTIAKYRLLVRSRAVPVRPVRGSPTLYLDRLLARCMSHSHMIVQKRYCESVSPDPAVESGLLAST